MARHLIFSDTLQAVAKEFLAEAELLSLLAVQEPTTGLSSDPAGRFPTARKLRSPAISASDIRPASLCSRRRCLGMGRTRDAFAGQHRRLSTPAPRRNPPAQYPVRRGSPIRIRRQFRQHEDWHGWHPPPVRVCCPGGGEPFRPRLRAETSRHRGWRLPAPAPAEEWCRLRRPR